MNNHIASWAKLNILSYQRYKILINKYQTLEKAWNKLNRHDLIELWLTKQKIDNVLKIKNTINEESELNELKKLNVKLIDITNEKYPDKLKDIYDPPVFLYYKWIMQKHESCLSVVGTRKTTQYWRMITENLVSHLCQKLIIVSGLALWIDSIAHKTCVNNKKRTIAVIGSGLDIIYPKENIKLIDEIIENGGAVISEHPLKTEPLAHHFPKRNRIISWLSLGTLVIEWKENSGSLITARVALEQNREVFAIPGHIYSEQSKWTNKIIQKWEAKLVTRADDIFEELSIDQESLFLNAKSVLKLSPEEEQITNILDHTWKDVSQIKNETTLHESKISATITMLEIKGIIINIWNGIWSLRN